MQLAEFDYGLPTELIPSAPVRERGTSRMTVVRRAEGEIEHRAFSDLVGLVAPGDVIVMNDTKVMPTLLRGRTAEGAEVRIDLVSDKGDGRWECQIRRIRAVPPGTELIFAAGELCGTVVGPNELGTGTVIDFDHTGDALVGILLRHGRYMLPMYLDQDIEGDDYQTVYASEPGSNQPPVAGMHFTEPVLKGLRAKGVEIAHVTLRIGRLDDLSLLGGERPIEEHRMYPEAYEVTEDAAALINRVRRAGGRVICVGTTSVRTLETVATADGAVIEGSGWTNTFITPGYRFKVVDALLSNLQPPFSTNIMLHSAFAGHELTMRAYREAVQRRHLFLEFGDCIFYM